MATKGKSPESVVKDITRKTRRVFDAEEKIRIVLEGLKGEESVATICRCQSICDETALYDTQESYMKSYIF